MLRRFSMLGLLGGMLVSSGLFGQGPTPSAGSPVPGPFRAYVVVDRRFEAKPAAAAGDPPRRDPRDRTQQLHCFVAEHGLNPTVAIFTRSAPAAEGPVAKLLTDLEPLLKQYRSNQLNGFAVFLTLQAEFPADNSRTDRGEFQRDQKAQAVVALADALKVKLLPLGLAATQSDTLTTWGLPAESETLVVVYHKLKIVQSWHLPAGGPTDEERQEMLKVIQAEATK